MAERSKAESEAELRLMTSPAAYPDQVLAKMEAFEAILSGELRNGERRDSILMLALGSIKQDVLNLDLCEGSAMTSRANRRANDPAALSVADKKALALWDRWLQQLTAEGFVGDAKEREMLYDKVWATEKEIEGEVHAWSPRSLRYSSFKSGARKHPSRTWSAFIWLRSPRFAVPS